MEGFLSPRMEAVAAGLAVSSPYRDLVVEGGVLLAVVIGAGLVIGVIRRWRMAEEPPPAEPWTLQNLRDLHAAGQLSDEEFDRLKAAMIAQHKAPVSPPEAQVEPELPPEDEVAG